MDFLVDDVLLVWCVMKFGTSEFKVVEFLIAELARKDFEFIRNIANLISDEAEQLIVHITLLEDLNETIIVQPEEH